MSDDQDLSELLVEALNEIDAAGGALQSWADYIAAAGTADVMRDIDA